MRNEPDYGYIISSEAKECNEYKFQIEHNTPSLPLYPRVSVSLYFLQDDNGHLVKSSFRYEAEVYTSRSSLETSVG